LCAHTQAVCNSEKVEKYRLKSCYVSHVHCAIAIGSCVLYWATQAVSVMSPEFMVEGPKEAALTNWMRRTIAFSVGYFANDLVVMLLHSEVGGTDMIAHHIIIGGFFLLGFLQSKPRQPRGSGAPLRVMLGRYLDEPLRRARSGGMISRATRQLLHAVSLPLSD
jgi:hypothetical protein